MKVTRPVSNYANMPEFHSTRTDGFLKLGTEMFFILRVGCLRIIEVVDPKIHTQRDGLQSAVKHLLKRTNFS